MFFPNSTWDYQTASPIWRDAMCNAFAMAPSQEFIWSYLTFKSGFGIGLGIGVFWTGLSLFPILCLSSTFGIALPCLFPWSLSYQKTTTKYCIVFSLFSLYGCCSIKLCCLISSWLGSTAKNVPFLPKMFHPTTTRENFTASFVVVPAPFQKLLR